MRRNLCPNPSARNDTTGYAGSATFARATDVPTPASPRSTGVRTTGAGFLQSPAAACAPGDVFTVSFYQHNGSGSFQFARTVYVGYTRSAGGDTFPETFNTGQLGADGTVARTSFTTAAAPANATGIYVLWDSLVAGLAMSSVLLEKVAALDTYGDGDTSGWAWDGAAGNSTSTLPDPTGGGDGEVILPDLMDEIFATLDAAGIGLNVPDDGGGVHAGPPAPYMELPQIAYGEPGPGLHRIQDLAITIIFGPANNAQIFRMALDYASPSGGNSIRAALQNHAWTSCGTVYVKSAEPSVEDVRGAAPAIAYTFHLDITGA